MAFFCFSSIERYFVYAKINNTRIPGYITCILDDSRIYANHAKKKFIDLDDVRLAVKMQLDRTFTNPPPRDVLLDVARAKNNIPLPFVKPHNGLRIPPDRYCLNATNYRLKNAAKKPAGKPVHVAGNNAAAGPPARAKVDAGKGGLSIVKRPGTLATVARTQTISIPKPVFKISTGEQRILSCRMLPTNQFPSSDSRSFHNPVKRPLPVINLRIRNCKQILQKKLSA